MLELTTRQVGALDSTGQAITRANPGNGTLKSLVDSTLLVLTAGVQAKRLDVTTNLTAKPLYFVGVHRAVSRAGSSFSTWTLVGMRVRFTVSAPNGTGGSAARSASIAAEVDVPAMRLSYTF